MRTHDVSDFVALHHGACIIRAAPVGRMFAQDARGTHRVGCPHVGDDHDAALQCRRHDRLHAFQQHRRVTLGWILGTIERLAGDGALGKAFHDQIIQLATFDDLHTGRNAVVGKACAATDSDLVMRHGITHRYFRLDSCLRRCDEASELLVIPEAIARSLLATPFSQVACKRGATASFGVCRCRVDRRHLRCGGPITLPVPPAPPPAPHRPGRHQGRRPAPCRAGRRRPCRRPRPMPRAPAPPR